MAVQARIIAVAKNSVEKIVFPLYVSIESPSVREINNIRHWDDSVFLFERQIVFYSVWCVF